MTSLPLLSKMSATATSQVSVLAEMDRVFEHELRSLLPELKRIAN